MRKTNEVGLKLILGLIATLSVSAAHAAMTYEGQIIKPDGSPMSGTVDLKIQVLSPTASSCVLFEEQFTVTASDDGYVSVELNSGAGVRTDSTSISFSNVFSNGTGNHTGLVCGVGGVTSYNPGATDGRQLAVFAKQGANPYESFPPIAINSVPYSMQASELDGLKPSEILRVPGQTVTALTSPQYTEFGALLSGTSSNYEQAGKINGTNAPSMTAGHALGWNGSNWTSFDVLGAIPLFAKTAAPTCGGSNFLQINAGTLACGTPSGGGAVNSVSVSAPITNTGTAADPIIGMSVATSGQNGYLASGDWTTFNNKQAALGFTPVNRAGDTLTGDLVLAGAPSQNGHAANKQYVDDQFTVPHDMMWIGTLASDRASAMELELQSGGPGRTYLKSTPNLSSDVTFLMPGDDGAPGDVLMSDGFGSLSWGTPAGGGDFMANGSTSMTGQFFALPGTDTVPGIVFNGDPDTGISNPMPNDIVITTGGNPALHIDSSGYVGVDKGVLTIGAKGPGGADGGELRIVEGGGPGYVSIHGPNGMSGSYDLLLPANQGAAGEVLTNDGSGVLSWQTPGGGGITALTGDIGASGSGSVAATIQASAVDTGKLANDAVTTPKIANSAVSYAKIQDISATNKIMGRFTAGAGPMEEISLGSNLSLSGGYLNTTGLIAAGTIANASGDIIFSPQVAGGVIVNQSTSSSSPSTGALIVAGGAGVAGNVNVGGDVLATNLAAATGSSAAPTFRFFGDSDTGMYSPTYDTIGFTAAGVPRVEITSSDLSSSNFGGASTFSLRRANGSSGSPVALPTAMNVGVVRFQGYDGTNYADGAVIGATSTEAWTGGAHGTGLSFATTTNGTSAPQTRMSIADNGNVGIGTTVPNGKLDVRGSMVMSGSTSGYSGFQVAPVAGSMIYTLPTSNPAAGNVLSSDATGNLSWINFPAGMIVNGGNSFGASAVIGTSDNYHLIFKTNGSNQMWIDPTGNVGIGLASPGQMLDVAGNIAVSSGSKYFIGTNPVLYAPMSNSIGLGQSAFGAYSSGGAFNTAVGSTALYAATSGASNTAIGAGSGESLTTGSNNTIVGKGAGGAVTTGGNNVFMGQNAGSNITVGSNNIFIGFGASHVSNGASDKLNIGNLIYGDMSAANVGIGTSSAAEALHVYKPSGARVVVESSAGANPAETVFKQGSSVATIGYNFTGTGDLTIENQNMSQGIQFNAGSSTRMYIKNNGKVGLGTMTPTFDLSFDSFANKLMGVERSGSLSGKNLTVFAGGAAPGASNSNGGSLILQGGVATGNAQSSIEFHTSGGGSSGVTDSSLTPKMIIDGTGVKIGSPANTIKQITAVQVTVGTCPSGALTANQTASCSGSITVPAGLNHSVTCSSPSNVPAIITGQVPNAGGTINVSVLAVGAVTSGQLSTLNCVVTSF